MTSCNEGELKWVPKDKLLIAKFCLKEILYFFNAVA